MKAKDLKSTDSGKKFKITNGFGDNSHQTGLIGQFNNLYGERFDLVKNTKPHDAFYFEIKTGNMDKDLPRWLNKDTEIEGVE